MPPRQLRRLAPALERIECYPGRVLADVDRPLDDIFFPETAVISVVAVYEDGGLIEMATIGREGCTGAQAVFGARVSPSRLLVQIPGVATRMPRDVFMRAMDGMPSFQALLHAYAQAFLEQVLVSVACNGAHDLSQRFARWLLTMRDRSDSDALQITQALLGETSTWWDYPSMSVGDAHLYLAWNRVRLGMMFLRINLAEIAGVLVEDCEQTEYIQGLLDDLESLL